MRAYHFRTISFLNLILLLPLLMVGCGRDESAEVIEEDLTQPTPSPEPTLTPFPTTSTITVDPTSTLRATPTEVPRWFEGLFVDVPGQLGNLGPRRTILEQLDTNLPADQRFPTHDLYLLRDWPISNLIEQPRILAFPARAYASINVLAQAEIEQLKQITEQPDEISDLSQLPFLPAKSNPQAFVAQGQIQSFKNGKGIRYLTWYPSQFSTEKTPELIYTWLGLSDDGHAVVSAVFPIEVTAEAAVNNLPSAPDIDSLSMFEQWMGSYQANLSALPNSAFRPTLDELDMLTSSIFVQLPEPELVFDTNGKVNLTLVYPKNGGQTIVGKPLEIEGYVQPGRQELVELYLLAGNNTIAAETVRSSLDGWFRATLNIPPNIQGNMQLIAIHGGQTSEILIALVDNPTEASEILRLRRPVNQQEIVATYPLYFEGTLNGPLINNTLSTGLLIDECQTLVAKQDLTLLPEDKYWSSVIEVPAGLSGDACAAAWTGSYGEQGWREIQIPIRILAEVPDRPEIVVGNPASAALSAGNSLVFGYAFAPAESMLAYTLLGPDGSETEPTTIAVSPSGRWEFELPISENSLNPILIKLEIIGFDSYNKLFSLQIEAP